MEKDINKEHKEVVNEVGGELKKKEGRIAICPQCDTRVICIGEIGQKIEIECTNCGKKGIVLFAKEEKKLKKLESKKTKEIEKKDTIKLKTHFSINQSYFKARIIGIIFITIGIVFLYNHTLLNTPLNTKIGIASILIGVFMIFFITEKDTSNRISDTQITLIMTVWVLVMFFITGDTSLEIFFILIFIGLLTVKEITDEFITVHLKNRVNVFIYMFLIIFTVIIAKKIISISGI